MTGTLAPLDLAVVGVYLAATVVLGVRTARRGTAQDDFLLAGRALTLPAFVVTLVATWYDRNSGAIVKVVSQNGTNDFHGSAFFKYDDPSLNAFNKFTLPTRVENKFRQYGGSVGGPIFRDKLFFFFTYEGAKSSSNVPYTAWIETPQFRQQVIAARPSGVTAQVFQATLEARTAFIRFP